jgi:hypothetical protein
MRNTADVTGGKLIAVLMQSISGVSAINPLVAVYDVHGGKGEVLFFVLSRTPHETYNIRIIKNQHCELQHAIAVGLPQRYTDYYYSSITVILTTVFCYFRYFEIDNIGRSYQFTVCKVKY